MTPSRAWKPDLKKHRRDIGGLRAATMNGWMKSKNETRKEASRDRVHQGSVLSLNKRPREHPSNERARAVRVERPSDRQCGRHQYAWISDRRGAIPLLAEHDICREERREAGGHP